jgi:hypothetical protein
MYPQGVVIYHKHLRSQWVDGIEGLPGVLLRIQIMNRLFALAGGGPRSSVGGETYAWKAGVLKQPRKDMGFIPADKQRPQAAHGQFSGEGKATYDVTGADTR